MKTDNRSFFFAAAFLAGLSLNAADWAQYRGPNLDGTTTEKIQWPAGGPKALWKVPTPDGFGSLVVSAGKAYTIVTRLQEGAPQETLVALDANTGREMWMANLAAVSKYSGGGDAGAGTNKGGDGARSTPTVDGDRVYTLSSQLALACFDAKSGKPVWNHDVLKEFAGKNITWQNAASPLIDGNLVFVAGGGPGQSLLAFDKADGKLAWKSGTETITHSTPVATTIHGVRQVIYFTQSGLVSVAAQTGAPLWKQTFKFAVSTAITPIVAGDIVYCAAGYGVGSGAYKISKNGNAFESAELWRITGNQPVANHWSTPVYKDGHLYGMFQFKEYGNGPLKCVELATGKVKWEKAGFGPGNVILVDGNVLALTDAGELVLVEGAPAAYKELARTKAVTGKCWSTPVLSNGRVYVRSTKEAACLDFSPKVAAR